MTDALILWTEGGSNKSNLHISLPDFTGRLKPVCSKVFGNPGAVQVMPYSVVGLPKGYNPCRFCWRTIQRLRQVEREGEVVIRGSAMIRYYRHLEHIGVFTIRDRITDSGRPAWHVTLTPRKEEVS